jgi:hypothetical protein
VALAQQEVDGPICLGLRIPKITWAAFMPPGDVHAAGEQGQQDGILDLSFTQPPQGDYQQLLAARLRFFTY